MAKGAKNDGLIISALDARNDNYFAGGYFKQGEKLTEVIPDGHYHLDRLIEAIKTYIDEQKLEAVTVIGTGVQDKAEAFADLPVTVSFGSQSENEIHAGFIGKLAMNEVPVDPDVLLPRYLRRTQAEVDWHKRTGKPFGQDSDYVEEV